MTQIGFKTTTSLTQKSSELPAVISLIEPRCRGFELGVKILNEYLDPSRYPTLKGLERDQYFMDRFKKLKQLYFEL